MYDIAKRKEVCVNRAQLEQDTYRNLLALYRYKSQAEAIGLDINKDLEDLKLLAKQLTENYIRNEGV